MWEHATLCSPVHRGWIDARRAVDCIAASGWWGVFGLMRAAVVAALAASLVYAASETDWAAVGRILAQAKWPALLLAVVFALGAVWTKSVRWRGLLAPRVAVDGRSALALVMAGQLANNGLPLRVGEVARVALLEPGAAGRAYVVSTIVAEKLLDACGLLFLAAVLGWLAPLPDWLRLTTPALMIASSAVLVVVLCTGVRIGPRWLASHAGRALAGLAAFRRRRDVVPAALWTLAGLAAGAAANWWSLDAVGVQPTIPAALLVLLALYVGGTLPSPPGRLGIFQALCAAAVIPFGVELSAALAFAVVHYIVVVIVPSALGALYLALWAGWRRRTAALVAGTAPGEPGVESEG